MEVLDAFRRAIYEAIYGDMKDDDRGRGLIERDFVLCEDSSSGGSQAVYRGSIFSSPGLTTETISHLLEQQVITGELSGVVVDKACPVSLFRTSEPLCRSAPTQHQDLDKDCQKRDQGTTIVAGSLATTTNCTCRQLADRETTVTVALLATALVAELFLVVFVILLVTASVMVVRRRRRWVSLHACSSEGSHQ